MAPLKPSTYRRHSGFSPAAPGASRHDPTARPILRLRWLRAPADRRVQPAWQEGSPAATEPEFDVMLVMQGSPAAPLPVVLSPLPAAAAASLGWAAWDEVLTIRRHPETARPDPGAFSSWDELLGCR